MIKKNNLEAMTHRKSEYAVDDIFVGRRSPRALSDEEISETELFSLFEAAKWAPSSFNNQPWRFVYAWKNTPAWDLFFNLLTEGNKVWARRAAVLLIVLSQTTFDHSGRPSKTHSFDAGAAWENFALQASLNGLVAHGMEGFDYGKAAELVAAPKNYQVEAMVGVGKPGRTQDLPRELQDREIPTDRKPISEIAFERSFKREAALA